MCPIAHVPHHPCAPSPKVPHLSLILTMIPLCPCVLLPMCQKKKSSCQKDVKLSKRCQAAKKMSSCQKDVKCQKVKHMDYGGGSQKNILT